MRDLEKIDSDSIVISSRLRLARNLESFPFPWKANPALSAEIIGLVRDVRAKTPLLADSIFYEMDQLSEVERFILLERHIISREHAANPGNKALLLSPDHTIAIMINEEDHLRIQVLKGGLELEESWGLLDKLEGELSSHLDFSFIPRIGYLTSCPTNTGTGLRVSCMLHLPALVLTKRINKILELVSKISFTSRGFFGEGTQALGDFFQVSNQVSLGVCEQELVDNLKGLVIKIRQHEIDCRGILLRKYRPQTEDSVWRALGLLKNCRLINSKEAMLHLSMLFLGLDLGIITSNDLGVGPDSRRILTALFLDIQPAHLQNLEKRELREKERDLARARLIRERLGG